MVRETRHLLVGNIPNNLNEERILDHFKKYGKVQSVKLLSRENSSCNNDYSATIAFNDIKSAAKAHNAENKIEERILKTNYYEPPANSTSSAIFIHESRVGDGLSDNQGSSTTTTNSTIQCNNQNVTNQTTSSQPIRSSVTSRHLMTNSNRLAEERVYDRVSNDNGYKRHYNDDRRINGRNHHDLDSRNGSHFRNQYTGRQNSSNSLNSFINDSRYSNNPSNNTNNSSNNELDNSINNTTNSGSLNQRILSSCIQRSNSLSNQGNGSNSNLTTNNNLLNNSRIGNNQQTTLSSVVVNTSNCNNNNSNNLISQTVTSSPASSFHQLNLNNNCGTTQNSSGSVTVRNSSIVDNNSNNNKSTITNNTKESSVTSLTILTKKSNHTSSNLSLTSSLDNRDSLSRESSKKSKKKKKKRKKSSSSSLHHHSSSHYNSRGEHRSNLNNQRCSSSMSCSDNEDNRESHHSTHSSIRHHSSSSNFNHNHHSSGSNLNNNNLISGNSGNSSHHLPSNSQHNSLNSSGHHSQTNQYHTHHNSNQHSPIEELDNIQLSPSSSSSNLSTASSSRVSRRCSISPSSTPFNIRNRISTDHISPLHHSSRKQSSASSLDRRSNSGSVFYKSPSNNQTSSQQQSSNSSAIHSQSNQRSSNNSSMHYQYSHPISTTSTPTNIINLIDNHGSNSNSDLLNDIEQNSNNRPLAICIRNLPLRSTDTSLKDGLFHEYKKHGKVTMVKVIGKNEDRFAVVCFKKYEDVEKALEVSKDKIFFGSKIEVHLHDRGLEGEDNDRPLEAAQDEYNQKATRTLFVGNLEKEITTSHLRQNFEQFGEIIEIDIKKQGTSTFAFIQYSDISSVVKAIRKLDGENLGNSSNRIKLGFGKSMPTTCVWVHGISEQMSEKAIKRQFSRYGEVRNLVVDKKRSNCLLTYDTIEVAQSTVNELKIKSLTTRSLQVDFASRECQNSFHQKLELSSSNGSSSSIHSRLSGSNSSIVNLNNNNDNSSVNIVNSLSGNSTISLSNNNLMSSSYDKTISSNNSNRLSSRLGSITSSPKETNNTNLPPLPQTQWSAKDNNSSASHRLQRLSSTVNSTNNNNSSSRHNNLKNYNQSLDNEYVVDSMDVDFYEDYHSNSNSSTHHNSLRESRRLSEQIGSCDDKLRGKSFSPHNNKSLDCDILSTKLNDRHLDDKNLLYNKNDEYVSKDRLNRRGSEDILNSYESWKFVSGEEDHYKNRFNKSGLSTPNHHYHYKNDETNNHNKQQSSLTGNLNRKHSPLSPINQQQGLSNKEIKDAREKQRLSSLNRQQKIQLPMDLPLPEFALNLKLNKSIINEQHVINSNKTENNCVNPAKEINLNSSIAISSVKPTPTKAPLNESISSAAINNNLSINTSTTTNLLTPLSIKCDDKINLQNKTENNKETSSSIMSPLNNTLTSPINSLRAQQSQRVKSESLSSDNSTENTSLKKSVPECLVSPEHSPKTSSAKSIDERIRALDNKFIPWSNNSLNVSTNSNLNSKFNLSSTNNSSIPSTPTDLLTTPISSITPTSNQQTSQPTTPIIDYSKYNIKKKSSSISSTSASNSSNRNEPSDIVKSLLSKSSIFDQDSKRLENINEKYEPKDNKELAAKEVIKEIPNTLVNKEQSIKEATVNNNNNKSIPSSNIVSNINNSVNNNNAPPSASISKLQNPQQQQQKQQPLFRTKAAAKDFHLPNLQQNNTTTTVAAVSTNNLQNKKDGSVSKDNNSNKLLTNVSSNSQVTNSSNTPNSNHPSSISQFNTHQTTNIQQNPQQSNTQTSNQQTTSNVHTQFKNKDDKSSKSKHLSKEHKDKEHKDKEHKEKEHKEKEHKEKEHKEKEHFINKEQKKIDNKPNEIKNKSSANSQQPGSNNSVHLKKKDKDHSSKDKDHKDKIEKKTEKKNSVSSSSSDQQSIKHEIKKQLSEEKPNKNLNKENSSSKEKDHIKEKLAKKKEKQQLKEKHDKNDKIDKLKSLSNKEHSKESFKEKDQIKEKLNKKSKKSKDSSMDLDTFSSPVSTKQSNKEHKQKDNEKKKSKKSISKEKDKEKDKDKEDTIDLEEEIRASKRYIAEMKKLGIQIDNEPMYLSMYDKVKARSSQNQSLKGTQPSAGPSGSNRSKSESDYGKNKSGRDTETDSESDSSNDEDDEIKQSNSRHFNALHQKQHSKNIIDSEDSDDEMPFNQAAKNKINKLNRKRKIETSSSSSSSSSESSDSDKDNIKQSKNQLELKRKKKQFKKQFSKSSTASTFNWMSDSEEEQKSNKHKNLSPSHSNKKNKLSNMLESKKSTDKEEHQIISNKKRSFQEDSIKNKDDKLKKKKLQKQLSISEDKNSSIDKENNEKKTSISKSISEHNEDSDDLSTIVSKQSSSSLKKKKKKRDKLKDKNQVKEKSIEHLQSPKSNSSFIKTPLNKQQLKEDLELSDSDSDINDNKITKDKNTKQQIKKETTSETVKDKKHKPKKDDKYEKKLSKNDDSKKLLQSESDSDDDNQQLTKIEKLTSKKQKKPIKDKERSIKSKSKIESDSSDNESITAQKSKKKDKDHKRNKDKKHQEISSKETKQQKQHRLKSINERQSSISDLSVKHNYSDKALTSDSESDSELDNLQIHTIAQIKSPLQTKNKSMSSSERIFNTLANRTKVFTSDESEQSDDNLSATLGKKDNTAISSTSFLSPNSKLPPITNNLIDNSADAWLMENSQTKCDTWNDITKTEESFRQYLNKTSVHSSSEWEESDDELIPKSTNLLNDSLPSPTSLPLNSTSNLVNHALTNQILKDPEPRPLTSSTGKEVLKAIKSPKKTTDLSCLTEQQKNKKKDNKQQKEDKCKENNEERKKKNKKSKDNRDQKSIKDDNTKKLLHSDLLFDSKEIKQEPVIAAAAQIHPTTQLFGSLNSLDMKPIKLENKLNLLNQPTSPFAEKQAYQLTPILPQQQAINASSKTNRLLTDLNQSTNKTSDQTSKLNERNDLFSNSNIEKTKPQLHTSPIRSDEIINSKQKLIKANEMMFSISDESSNEFPAIGVSFSSSSSNSSNSNSGSGSNNQNMTMLPNLSNNKEKQDKQPVQRKYEEEAAIEAKRLEAELMKSKDLSSNWKSFKDPTKDLFLDLMNNTNERLSTSSNNSTKSTTANLPSNKSMAGHKKPQNKSIVLENATTIFNVITAGEVKDPFLDSDETQFKIADGKDELDDQRKIEDDLAVSALLELEMKNTDDLSSEQDSCSNKTISTTPSNKQRKLLTSNDLQQNPEEQQSQSQQQQKQAHKADLLIDEEPHRLQIAEDDLLNDNNNSVDSDDAFHSAIDEMPEKDEETSEAISAITGIIGNLGDTTSHQDSIKSPLHKLRSPLLSPTHNNINLLQPNMSNLTTVVESKLSQSSIIDVTSNTKNNQNLFNQDLQLNSNSDYGADENELTIDLNEEDDNLKKSSFMSTLEKLTSDSKQRKNSSSSSISLFDLPLINTKDNLTCQQETEIPTSLADVKQTANKIKNNTPEPIQTLASPKQSFSSICTSTAILTTSSLNKSPEKESNQSEADAMLLSPNNRKHIEEESLTDKPNQEQRPRRGRRAKTRKSSESEDGLKLINTPLSPTNISPNNSLNISGSKDSIVTTAQSTSSKSQSHPRRSARGLINSSNDSNDKHQQEDLVQNDSDNQSTNNADDNQSLNSNTDSKRKRGRKKKGEQTTKSDFNTGCTLNKNETISLNKNLSPYDVFEFNDSDEENSPTLPLMSLHGHIEQSHRTTAPNSNLLQDLQSPPANNIKQSTELISEEENKNNDNTNVQHSSVTSFFEQITPSTPSTQAPFSLLTNTSLTTTQSNNSQTEQDKEYTTELNHQNQKGKISITIRLQQKDKDQSSNSPEHSLDHSNDKLTDDNQNSSNSTDLTSSNNKPMTRKSARLQSQNNNKTTIDDVIEDVVKGNFNEDSHDYSLSAAENQEYTDLVEESGASENEVENENNEENQNTENLENKRVELSFSNIIDNKHQSAIKETNKSTGRITRSSAKNVNDDSLESTNTESVEIKLPNTTFSVAINNDNLINTTSSSTPSISTPPTVITTSKTNTTQLQTTISTALTTTTFSTSNAKQHTVLKVELPKFINQKNNEQQQKDNPTTNKPIEEEIKKEEQLQNSNNNNNNSQIDPLVSKLSNSSITPKPSPSASPLIQDLKPNINIPNISERIHNSTTALKLKTGKFHLDDNYQVGYQQPATIPVSSTSNSEVSQPQLPSQQSTQQMIHSKLQQPSIPTSVVVTSNSTINQTPITTQPLIINNTNINIPITSSAASPFKSQQQPPISTQSQLILQSPFTAAGSLSAQDLNLLHQQQLLLQQMQQNPGQFMNLNNAYLAALHPDAMRSLPLGAASLPNRFEGFNPTLEDNKLQLQKQSQNSVIESSMPPPLLSSIRLPTPLSANYPLIRTPMPPHLLSPHERQNSPVNMQRFTESPYNRGLMSPNPKVDIKPNINMNLQQAHQNNSILQPQRPQSQFSLPSSVINSPSPVPCSILQPQQSNTPNSALSPSLGYRKDLQSPIINQQIDLSNQSIDLNTTAIHPRKLHHKAYAAQQAAKESNLLNSNLMPSPYQIPSPHHLLNSQAAYQQMAALSMQQQLNSNSIAQIRSPQPPPVQQIQDQTSGDHSSVLMQKHPKLWQGLLALKMDQAAVQMHFVSGNPIIAQNALPHMIDGTGITPLKIVQRMRLETTQLEGLDRKMQQKGEHCILLALPCGRDHDDVLNQSMNLRNYFIQYLQSKKAAGIINSNDPVTNQPAYVVHIFPSCDFANENLARIAPDLLASCAEIEHLLVVIATV